MHLALLLQNVDPDYEVDYSGWVWVGVVFLSIVIVFFCYQKYIIAKKAAEAHGAARRLAQGGKPGEPPQVSEDGVL